MSNYLELKADMTSEQRALKEKIYNFGKSVLRPAAIQSDRLNNPSAVIAPNSPLRLALKAAYAEGYHTLLVPKECGGMGLSGLDLHIALEEMGWASAEFAAGLAVSGFPFAVVASTRNSELIAELVVPFVNDKEGRSIGCWAITEPEHGSDHFMAGMPQFYDSKISGQVTARLDGDSYIINGSKSAWVSNGTIATHAVTYLTLDPSKGISGGAVAFIPLNLPGVSKGAPLDKMGQHALNQGSIVFDNVKIPKRYLLIDTSAYEFTLQRTLTLANATMGSIFTGVARAAYEEALAYTKIRIQGGKPICEHQLVQKHLFDMFTKVEACRALSRAVMEYNGANPMAEVEFSIASKTFCTQASFDVANIAMQLHGGKGLAKDSYVEKLFRDARASLIEDGVNDILALIGARQIIDRK